MTEIEKRESVLKSVRKVLIEKNKRYGNAALSPIGVFYKGDATTSIYIRLDDKLSRIKNSDILRTNDMFDLLGYSILLVISKMKPNSIMRYHDTFQENVDEVINEIVYMYDKRLALSVMYTGKQFSYNGFSKKENTAQIETINTLNGICTEIKKSTSNVNFIDLMIFITYIVEYFVNIDKIDFTELID